MVVITVASRNSGSGKSTLTAHLSTYAYRAARRCLLIDADPQGTLTRWHGLQRKGKPLLRNAADGIDNLVKAAADAGIEWIFVDTPAKASQTALDAIRAATLVVIPARPSTLQLGSMRETITSCREWQRRFAVVLNDAPPHRDSAEAPVTATARECLGQLKIPVWSGQITRDPSLSLSETVGWGDYDPQSRAAGEFVRLLSAVEHFVEAIQGRRVSTVNMADLIEPSLISQPVD